MNPRILTLDEVKFVLDDLHGKPKRQWSSWLNLAVFRIFVGCGCRAIEAAGLDIDDLTFDGPFPRVHVRAEITKGRKGERKSRNIPLDWDHGTLVDLRRHVRWRKSMDNGPHLLGNGHRLSRSSLRRRFKTSVKSLGKSRAKELGSHAGRRTFGSTALHVGYSLTEVRDAMGHANISVTSRYLYAIPTSGLRDIYS